MSAIAADAQFPVDGLVFEGPCSQVFLGRHVFRPRLPMTDRRLPGAPGRLACALRSAAGCWWRLIRIVLRRGSTPQERYCGKGITYCAHLATPPERRASLRARQEIAYRRSDLVTVRLEGEVAGVEEPHISVWNVTLERLGALREEKRVVLAPSCQKRRLVLAKIGLEFGIERDVALVVAEEVELHFVGARSCEIEVVEGIPVRRNRGRVRDAVGVLPDRGLGREKGAQRCAVCFGRVLPICADRLPAVAEALDIRIAILRDDGGDAFGMPHREAETRRCAIVEDIDGEAAESDHFSEAVNSARDVIEGVAELGPFRHVRLAKPGQIGRKHMKSVGELRNEIPEHVACGWKAVQQKERRSVRATGLPVEDFDAVDGYAAVCDLSHLSRRKCARSITSTSTRRRRARSRAANLPGRNGAPRPSPRSA